jgi:hypothetical protein
MSCSNPFLEITTAYAEAARFTDFGADSDIPAGAEWSKSAIKAMDDDCRAFLARRLMVYEEWSRGGLLGRNRLGGTRRHPADRGGQVHGRVRTLPRRRRLGLHTWEGRLGTEEFAMQKFRGFVIGCFCFL